MLIDLGCLRAGMQILRVETDTELYFKRTGTRSKESRADAGGT